MVEQVSPTEVYGMWTLLQPNNVKEVSLEKAKQLTDLPAGTYTMIVDAPDGANATIRLYNGNAEIKAVERPQMTFTITDGDSLKLVIHYVFTRVGMVSVQSDPPGLTFTLTGPNNLNVKGATPMGYEEMPEGQYKVQFDTLDGCVVPAPKSALLEKNKRATFDVTLSCAAADALRANKQEQEEKFVTNKVEGQDIVFRDVPQDSWFAPAVFKATQRGILGGYKNAAGEPTGEFGPGNNVTIAELAKIAHKIAGLSETELADSPRNEAAQGEWFSYFIASAEERGWTIYVDATIDPLRHATRGEVLVTLLQALDIAQKWPKGKLFDDVVLRTPFAGAIETAADLKIVEGRKDDSGNLTGTFGPQDPITRAEMAKIANVATDIVIQRNSSN